MKTLKIIDCTGSISMALEKPKYTVEKMWEQMREHLGDLEDPMLMKLAGYRNY
jgi:hypothetical protein